MARTAAVLLILLAVGLSAALGAAAAEPAKPFTVFPIDGGVVTTESLRGKVVVLEFSGTWCVPCRFIEAAFKEMVPQYDPAKVVFLSVFVGVSNDNASIEFHRETYGTTWTLATAPPSLMPDYGVISIPRVFVIDREGYVTHDWQPIASDIGLTEQTKQEIGPAIDRALGGTATPVDVVALSIPVLLVVAGFLSFFSPCSFPVLPAFMAYYLNLEAKGGKAGVGTAAGRGFVASLGIIAVYGLIAAVVAALGIAAQAVVPFLSPVVGLILVSAGILILLPFQYHFLTRPFVALKQRLAARLGSRWTPGIGAKLFAFGAGYGAAGFACVAPVFIGAVLAASALGDTGQAAVGLLLYVLVVIGLMTAVTVALHVAGDKALNKVKSWSVAMKYISATALLVAGGYLLLAYYLAFLA